MAIRDEYKEWTRKEINSAIDSLRPHGWRKTVFVLRELGPLAASIAIVVALLGITLGAVYQSTANVREETTFRVNTAAKLTQIDGTLTILQADFAAAKYSAVPQEQLKKYQGELKAIKGKLAESPRDTPGFWSASFQVINLLSKATSPVTAQHPLLDLTDVSGIGTHTIVYPPGSVIRLHKQIKNSTFTDAIAYLDTNVVLYNVTFVNCTLVLPEVQVPPAPLQDIGNQLLSAFDLSHLTLTAS